MTTTLCLVHYIDSEERNVNTLGSECEYDLDEYPDDKSSNDNESPVKSLSEDSKEEVSQIPMPTLIKLLL